MLSSNTRQALQKQTGIWREEGMRIALVPTMGNLHAGHLKLVTRAQEIADKTVVSIFVNPTQFVAGEDFDDYPRTFNEDSQKLSKLDTDLIFTPDINEMYGREPDDQTVVTVSGLDKKFCGIYRPGHFTGVATIVTKLFNIVQPDVAIFGEKDYQQLLVIKKLVLDLCLPVEIIGVETVRETDGLALSSRNYYLAPEERKIAPLLYKTLTEMAEKIKNGEQQYKKLELTAAKLLDNAGFKTEYISVCNAESLDKPGNGDLVILAAVWLGKARLIDNIVIRR